MNKIYHVNPLCEDSEKCAPHGELNHSVYLEEESISFDYWLFASIFMGIILLISIIEILIT